MAQHYNNYSATSGASTPPESTTTHSVPEDFDLTNFLLRSRPPDGGGGDPDDTSWPRRVQDMKNQSGNTSAVPNYGLLPENYPGWSTNTANLRKPDGSSSTTAATAATAATGMYNSSCWAPGSVAAAAAGSSVYSPNYNPASNLGYSGVNPGYNNNLSHIWGGDGALFTQREMDAAAEGREMYGFAWNDWERPLTESSQSNTASPVKNRNTETSTNQGVEELRSGVIGGNRKDRGESSVSAHSSTSWPSKGNNSSIKDSCSGKTFSDVTKEDGKQQGGVSSGLPRNRHQQPGSVKKPGSASVNTGSGFQTTSALKPPSHYSTVAPPPGFETSQLHMPGPGPDSQYGLDDFVGTSAKVHQWLQQSRDATEDVDEEGSNIPKAKASKKKKKKKLKKLDPLAGSVASFIRDWNSAASESTDPSSVEEIGKATVKGSTSGDTNSTESVGRKYSTSSTDNNSRSSCNQECRGSYGAATPPPPTTTTTANKDQRLFFDPKRIFQESGARKSASLPKKKAPTPATFDPKRIFQTKDNVRPKGDIGSDYHGNQTLSTGVGDTVPNLEPSVSSSQDRHRAKQTAPPIKHDDTGPKVTQANPVHKQQHSPTVEDLGSYKTTTATPQSRRGSGDNRPINNKGSAQDISGASLSHSGVKSSMGHGGQVDEGELDPGYSKEIGASATRSDLSGTGPSTTTASAPSASQNAKGKQSSSTKHSSQEPVQSTTVKGTRQEDMRTRSQARREEEEERERTQHRYVPPGDGDHVPSRQDSSSRRHDAFNFDEDYSTKDKTGSNCNIPPPAKNTQSKHRPGSSQNTTTAPSSKPGGRVPKDSQPGWKKNKGARNSRSSDSKPGKQKRDHLPPRHGFRSDSPGGSMDRNGMAKGKGRHRETSSAKDGRHRQDSEGTNENPAHYYDGKKLL